MLKAQQANLVQQASNDLVNIRNIEIQYYVNFFSNIGIQSAFIAGYQLSTISQVERTGDNSILFSYAYWITSVISICCSLESLLVSLYLTVFGQGLALRGPAGSMIKAINAFNYYQKHVLLSFTLNIFFLGISTICQFYVFMTIWGAHICAVLMVIGMSVWWIFCLQVFNRFKYVEDVPGWRQDHEHSRFSEVNPADTMPGQRDSLEGARISSGHMGSMDGADGSGVGGALAYPSADRSLSTTSNRDMFPDDASVASGASGHGRGVAMQDATWRRRIFSKFLNKSGASVAGSSVSGSVNGDVHSVATSSASAMNPMAQQQASMRKDANFEKVLHQGDMELRTAPQGQPRSAWMARFGLLVNSGLLMVFTSKADYDRNPNSALCKLFKAISVSKYTYSSVQVDGELLAVLTPRRSGSPSIEIKLGSDAETKQFLDKVATLIAAGGGDFTKKA
jgi:hypothetical protein